ncbi:antibiotic biosynthesis monooxygenase [Kineosporia rhizophila]|uniref:antibiotic biosynthesis monooxygenase family protein n=1 Tax=Kineosporia rhizophila TaxID=84633 RepID=UPI000B01D625|nr:antibiotic biosynthesis monooxygenase family protein [Kineosporia rhizophila]MCE0537641.1 antibiotic biosynthesis monooxygenase [Kineosporia rhizophila]
MPLITPDNGSLTVFNLFNTTDLQKQATLLEAMRGIISNANYDGWRSSTLHGGIAKPCAANYIQWRSLADLRERYEGENFKHNTVPYFTDLTTSVHLLKTEVVTVQSSADAPVLIDPDRDDFTVIVLMGCDGADQAELVDLMTKPDEWMRTQPGYRSHSILRGLDGDIVVNYAQWDSQADYERFHDQPEQQRPRHDRDMRARARSLLTSYESNTYEVVFSRSLEEATP